MHAGGQIAAQFGDACVDVGWRGLRGFNILLADLLLYERAADQLFEGVRARERSFAGARGIENGEANLVIEIAGQDGTLVDDGDHVVQDDGRLGWGSGRRGEQQKGDGKDRNPARERVTDLAPDWRDGLHQNVCPRLKKKLKCGASPRCGSEYGPFGLLVEEPIE